MKCGQCGNRQFAPITDEVVRAHLWFFLDEDIAARTVRAALTYLLTVTLEEHPEIGLSSYDRIIPCQDTLPKGGLGNLIALPIQREPRQVGNSVFVNDDLVPLADQWAFLSSVRRVTRVVPRGCLESAREILERQGYRLEVSDKRYSGVPLDVSFNGELRPMQKDAAKSLAKFDTGTPAAKPVVEENVAFPIIIGIP